MKKSISTFLKYAEKDKIARSANPAIVRASTVYFKTMQEMRKHQKNKYLGIHYTRGGPQRMLVYIGKLLTF